MAGGTANLPPQECLLQFCAGRVAFSGEAGKASSYAWDGLLRGTGTYAGAGNTDIGISTDLATESGVHSALDALISNDPFFSQTPNINLADPFRNRLYGSDVADRDAIFTQLDAQLRQYLTGGAIW